MIECICIVDKKTGIISWMNNEFYYSTGFRMNDCIYDQIDKSIDNGNDFISRISNIVVQTNRIDLFSIHHQMITKDGWIYTMIVNSIMNIDYISLIIRDSPSLHQRLSSNPVYRIKMHCSAPVKVLVVDDSTVECKFIKNLLDQTRIHSCDIETDSITFLDTNIHQYDLFIFDINMPGYSGINLIEMIKGDSRLKPNAKFAAISSDEDPNMITQSLEKGFDMFVPKPINRYKVSYLIETYKMITLE